MKTLVHAGRFTRIDREREREHFQRTAATQELIAARHAKRELRDIKQRLVDLLTADIISVSRGLEFEKAITDLFSESGLTIEKPFTVQSDKTGSVVEQIDGAIEVRSRTFLVECKCWKSNISRQELAPLLVSVYNRGNVGGIFISASNYTESALADARAGSVTKTDCASYGRFNSGLPRSRFRYREISRRRDSRGRTIPQPSRHGFGNSITPVSCPRGLRGRGPATAISTRFVP